MVSLPIKASLSEDTRMGSIHLATSVLVEMHREPESILMVVDKNLWNSIFEQEE